MASIGDSGSPLIVDARAEQANGGSLAGQLARRLPERADLQGPRRMRAS
jgi:hypothetical protein